MEAIAAFFTTWAQALWGIVMAVARPDLWLAWTGGLETPEDKESLMRFIYYGAWSSR